MGSCMSFSVLSRNSTKKQAEGTTIYEKEMSSMEKEVTGDEDPIKNLEENIKKAEDIIRKEEENIKKAEEEEVRAQQPDSEGVFDRLRRSPPTQFDLRAAFHGL